MKLIPSKAQLIFSYKVQKKYWPRSIGTEVLNTSDTICPKILKKKSGEREFLPNRIRRNFLYQIRTMY